MWWGSHDTSHIWGRLIRLKMQIGDRAEAHVRIQAETWDCGDPGWSRWIGDNVYPGRLTSQVWLRAMRETEAPILNPGLLGKLWTNTAVTQMTGTGGGAGLFLAGRRRALLEFLFGTSNMTRETIKRSCAADTWVSGASSAEI